MVGIDTRNLLDPLRVSTVVCERVMRVGNADFAVGANAALAAGHEGDDAR